MTASPPTADATTAVHQQENAPKMHHAALPTRIAALIITAAPPPTPANTTPRPHAILTQPVQMDIIAI